MNERWMGYDTFLLDEHCSGLEKIQYVWGSVT